MKRMHTFGLVLVTVLMLGALGVSSAFAADEWLVGAQLVGLAEKISVVSEAKWLILMLTVLGNAHIVCSGKFKETVNGLNPSGRGTGQVISLEGLNAEANTINCEVLHTQLGLCSGSLLALLTALRLPWSSELLLRTGDATPREMIVAGTNGRPDYKLDCTLSTGAKTTEECEGNLETEPVIDEANGTISETIPETNDESCKEPSIVNHIRTTGLVVRTLGGAALAAS